NHGCQWRRLSRAAMSKLSGTDNGSILTLYRRLLSVRRDHAALSSGAFRLIGVQGNALVYERADERERIVICRNFGDGAQQVSVDDVDGASILVSTYPARTTLSPDLVLSPNEGLMMLLKIPSV
ncbi:MAG: DUF3459 domain-containing protein, partial [Pseudolabrys sp.]